MRNQTKIVSMLLPLIIGVSLCLRWVDVQSRIANTPIKITDIANSGYVPPGEFGHGYLHLKSEDPIWYIFDRPAPDIGPGKVRKVCYFGAEPSVANGLEEVDVDFFYFSGAWYKLRTGHVTITGTKFIPPKNTMWKGWVSSKAVFPVNSPDFPYRLKIIYSKLKHGSSSPKEYLESLKKRNPSCFDMPAL